MDSGLVVISLIPLPERTIVELKQRNNTSPGLLLALLVLD